MSLPLPSGDPCYFCEIVSGRADRWNVIEQTDVTMTVLNGRQFEVGQCIIVPTRHAPTILDLTDAEASAIITSAKRMTRTLLQAFETAGILVYQNNGVGSGQEVPHFHLHVVPRRQDSDWGLGPPHLARLAGNRPAHLDHTVVTELKRQTVEEIRSRL